MNQPIPLRHFDSPGSFATLLLGATLTAGCWSPVSFDDVPREEEGVFASGRREQVAEIGPAGGTIELEKGVALTLPRNALPRDESIGVRTADEDEVPRPPARFEAASDIVEVTPHGLKLEEPARLRLPYVRPEQSDTPKEPRVLRLADPASTEWETVARRDSFDLGDSMEVELREFSFYLVAFVPVSAGAPGAGGSTTSCEVGAMRCGGLENLDALLPGYEGIFGNLDPDQLDPSLFGGQDFDFGIDIMVCTARGWEVAESCAPGGSCRMEGGEPRCVCGGDGQGCCLDDADVASVCDEGLDCNNGLCGACGGVDEACCPDDSGNLELCDGELQCLGGTCQPCGGEDEACCAADSGWNDFCEVGLRCSQDVCRPCGGEDEMCCVEDNGWNDFCEQERQCLEDVCKSTCECPSGATCFTEGNEISGFTFSCGGERVQCEAEGAFYAEDGQDVTHPVERVQWTCGLGQRCATYRDTGNPFGGLADRITCIAPEEHLCSRGDPGTDDDLWAFRERFCGPYQACLVCSDVRYDDGDPPSTTSSPNTPSCYSGLSTDPACSLEDPETGEIHEWRCPPDTTCSTTQRGRCERTAGPFYPGDGYQSDRTCY